MTETGIVTVEECEVLGSPKVAVIADCNSVPGVVAASGVIVRISAVLWPASRVKDPLAPDTVIPLVLLDADIDVNVGTLPVDWI